MATRARERLLLDCDQNLPAAVDPGSRIRKGRLKPLWAPDSFSGRGV